MYYTYVRPRLCHSFPKLVPSIIIHVKPETCSFAPKIYYQNTLLDVGCSRICKLDIQLHRIVKQKWALDVRVRCRKSRIGMVCFIWNRILKNAGTLSLLKWGGDVMHRRHPLNLPLINAIHVKPILVLWGIFRACSQILVLGPTGCAQNWPNT